MRVSPLLVWGVRIALAVAIPLNILVGSILNHFMAFVAAVVLFFHAVVVRARP